VIITSFGALGAEIQRARKHRGLTQAQLAEQAGVGRSWIVRIERGVNAHADLSLVLKVIAHLNLQMHIVSANESPHSSQAGPWGSEMVIDRVLARHRPDGILQNQGLFTSPRQDQGTLPSHREDQGTYPAPAKWVQHNFSDLRHDPT